MHQINDDVIFYSLINHELFVAMHKNYFGITFIQDGARKIIFKLLFSPLSFEANDDTWVLNITFHSLYNSILTQHSFWKVVIVDAKFYFVYLQNYTFDRRYFVFTFQKQKKYDASNIYLFKTPFVSKLNKIKVSICYV